MRNPSALIGRCTIQRANGEFCDAAAMEDLPYPVCGRHAFSLFRHMIAMVDAESGASSVLRMQAAMDWLDGAPTRRTSRPAAHGGVVYYLMLGELVKIGWTTNVDRRLSEYPPTAKLLATEPGTRGTEAERLQQFRKYGAARREWFTAGPDLLEYIQGLADYRAA